MADVKFKVVEFMTPTGSVGTTSDITSSGFGTVKAAIFVSAITTEHDVVKPGSYFSIGTFDGTNQAASFTMESGNVGTTQGHRADSDSLVYGFTSSSGDILYELEADSFITDGVRVKIVSGSYARSGYVILIGGTDVADAYVGVHQLVSGTSAQNITAPGFEPSMVFIHSCGTGGTLGTSYTENILSYGIALNDGSDTQRSSLINARNAVTTTKTSSYISNTAAYGRVYDSALGWLNTVSDFDADGFSITNSVSVSGVHIPYLALRFTNSPDLSLFDLTIPTSGNYAETTPGFEPSFGFMSFLVGLGSRNSLKTTDGFVQAISAFDDSSISTHGVMSRDALSVSDAHRLTSDSLTVQDISSGGTTNAVVASNYAFDSDGWDFTLSTNPSIAVLGWGLAIGSGASAVTLTVNGITQSQSIDGITLTQANQLSVTGIEQGQLLGTTALVQANVIAVAGVEQAQTLDNVVLTQAHIIAVNDIDQSQTIGGVTLAQAGSIAPAGIAHAQLIDAVTLTQANILSVANIEQAQSLDSVTLTVAGSLAIQSVLQGQTIDATALTQAHTISVDGLTQGQAIDAAALVQHYQLAVQSLIQGQTLGNVTLSAAGLVLEVDGMAQGQTVAAAGLTEHAVLSVNNLTQSQIIDIVNLGGLVIGSLEGTLVMYAKLGGDVVSYTLLDGTVQTVH